MTTTLRNLLVAALFAIFGAGIAAAATVKIVNVKKKLVAIELGDGVPIEKGTKICIYDDKDTQVACGKVLKTKGNLLLVKLPSVKLAKKVKAGMVSKIEGPNGGDPNDVAEEDLPKDSPFRIWGFVGQAFSTPATYNNISYLAPTSASPASLWSADKAVTSAIGLSLQFGIPLGTFSLNPGVRYHYYTPIAVDSDYQPSVENPYVSVDEKATAIGVWLDFQYFRKSVTPKVAFDLTSGLDVDMSTVTMTATQKDDNKGTSGSEAKATSKLSVASVRFGGDFEWLLFKPVGISFGTTLMVPVAEFGKSFTGDLTNGDTRGLAVTPKADLQKQIGHKKGKYALEFMLGTVLAF